MQFEKLVWCLMDYMPLDDFRLKLGTSLKSLCTMLGNASVAAILIMSVTTAPALRAASIYNFEGFADSTILSTQYAGVTFSNAIILTSGISLNEFEFPPHSGVNVVSDNGGPMTISFAAPITSFSGYLTYAEALTLDAFNSASSEVASTTSAFSSNLAISGVPGSTPNELLTLSFAGGASSVTITGDPSGGSFVLDDLTISTGAPTPTVPEPSSEALAILGGAVFVSSMLRRRSQS